MITVPSDLIMLLPVLLVRTVDVEAEVVDEVVLVEVAADLAIAVDVVVDV